MGKDTNYELCGLLLKADTGDLDAMAEIFGNFFGGEYKDCTDDNLLAKLQGYAVKLAENKRMYQIIELARQYTVGELMPENGEKAIEIYELAEKAGVDFGYQGIGEMYYRGHGVEQDYAKAYDYFMRHDNISFCTIFFLGEMYHFGYFVEQDDKKAMEYYRRITDSKSESKELDDYYCPACYRLANLLFTKGDNPEVVAEALEYITIAKKKADKLGSMKESCGFAEAKISKADVSRAFAVIKEAKEAIFSNIITPDMVYDMGLKYYFGTEKKQDYKKAVSYFEKAAAANYWQGKMMLGICAAFGYGMEKDEKLAEKYLGETMEQLEAMEAKENFDELTRRFFGKEYLKVEWEDALDFIFLGEKAGFPRAQLYKGDYFRKRNLGEADIKWAKEEYKKAYEGGCSRGGAWYGRLCYIGDDDEEEIGLRYLKKAAVDGDVMAMELLGDIYKDGDCYTTADSNEAFYWIMKAAALGAEEAQYELAVAYDFGEHGFRKDEIAATAWYERSAAGGNTLAMNNLGINYLNGFGGCVQDEARAVEWFKKAAEEGNARAVLNLARCCWQGTGTEKNVAQAVELLDMILEAEEISEELRNQAAEMKKSIEEDELA